MQKIIIELADGTRISSGANAAYAIKSHTITECVNSGAELTLGSTCSACLEAQIIAKDQKIGLSARQLIKLYKVDTSGSETKAGTFWLETPAKKSDNVYRVTAYDRVVDLDKDLSDWLKNLTGWPYNLITFARMVCEACGLTLATTDIPNGSFPVQKFYKAGATGRRLMEWICEIACRFCRANADGNIELAWYADSGVTIQPAGDRYYFSGALSYEDYEVASIDAVQLRLADSDSGALWPQKVIGTVTYEYLRIRSGPGVGYSEVGQLSQGDTVEILEQKTVSGAAWGRIKEGWICITGYADLKTAAADNPYIITGNPILLANVTADLVPCLEAIHSQLAALPAYKPCKVSLPTSPDIQAGHMVQVIDKHGNQFITCVMTKIQTGQRNTLECTGSARRDSSAATNNRTATQIAQQAVELQTQRELFAKITNGGQVQGLFMGADGQIYLNISYAVTGLLAADLIDVDNLIARRLKAESASNSLEIGDGELRMRSEGKDLMAVFYEDSPWMVMLNPEQTRSVTQSPSGFYVGSGSKVSATTALARMCTEIINGALMGVVTTDMVNTDEIGTKSGTSLPKLFGKSIQWAPTDDGKYTLIGVD